MPPASLCFRAKMSLMGLPQEPLPNRMFSLRLFLLALHIQILICNDHNVSRATEGPVYSIYYNLKGIYGIYWITFLFAQSDLKQWFVVFFITVEWSSFSSENRNLCLCLFRVAKHSWRVFVLSCSLHVREKQVMLKVETLNGGLIKSRRTNRIE